MTWLVPNYEIHYLAGGQLLISSTPAYAFGSFFLVLGLVPAVFFCYRMYVSRGLQPAFGIVIFAFPLFFSAAMVLRTGSLTLDKNMNTTFVHAPKFLWHEDYQINLRSIDHAEIRTMSASSYIALVLKSGEALTFADSTQEGGKGQAVVAINRYLDVSSRRIP